MFANAKLARECASCAAQEKPDLCLLTQPSGFSVLVIVPAVLPTSSD